MARISSVVMVDSIFWFMYTPLLWVCVVNKHVNNIHNLIIEI